MNQAWISEPDATVLADHTYVPVDEDGREAGPKRFFRRNEAFPVPPVGALGWLPEGEVIVSPPQN
jgi:hypothetical protein